MLPNEDMTEQLLMVCAITLLLILAALITYIIFNSSCDRRSGVSSAEEDNNRSRGGGASERRRKGPPTGDSADAIQAIATIPLAELRAKRYDFSLVANQTIAADNSNIDCLVCSETRKVVRIQLANTLDLCVVRPAPASK